MDAALDVLHEDRRGLVVFHDHRGELVVQQGAATRRQIGMDRKRPLARRRDCHVGEKLRPDLVAEPSRSAVNRHDDIVHRETECACDLRIVHLGDMLYLEIVIARPERPHLVLLPPPCLDGHG